MDEKFLTKYEKKILSRNNNIVARFEELKEENPNVPACRIMKVIADEFELNTSAVYRILIKTGKYERRYNTRKSA